MKRDRVAVADLFRDINPAEMHVAKLVLVREVGGQEAQKILQLAGRNLRVSPQQPMKSPPAQAEALYRGKAVATAKKGEPAWTIAGNLDEAEKAGFSEQKWRESLVAKIQWEVQEGDVERGFVYYRALYQSAKRQRWSADSQQTFYQSEHESFVKYAVDQKERMKRLQPPACDREAFVVLLVERTLFVQNRLMVLLGETTVERTKVETEIRQSSNLKEYDAKVAAWKKQAKEHARLAAIAKATADQKNFIRWLQHYGMGWQEFNEYEPRVQREITLFVGARMVDARSWEQRWSREQKRNGVAQKITVEVKGQEEAIEVERTAWNDNSGKLKEWQQSEAERAKLLRDRAVKNARRVQAEQIRSYLGLSFWEYQQGLNPKQQGLARTVIVEALDKKVEPSDALKKRLMRKVAPGFVAAARNVQKAEQLQKLVEEIQKRQAELQGIYSRLEGDPATKAYRESIFIPEVGRLYEQRRLLQKDIARRQNQSDQAALSEIETKLAQSMAIETELQQEQVEKLLHLQTTRRPSGYGLSPALPILGTATGEMTRELRAIETQLAEERQRGKLLRQALEEEQAGAPSLNYVMGIPGPVKRAEVISDWQNLSSSVTAGFGDFVVLGTKITATLIDWRDRAFALLGLMELPSDPNLTTAGQMRIWSNKLAEASELEFSRTDQDFSAHFMRGAANAICMYLPTLGLSAVGGMAGRGAVWMVRGEKAAEATIKGASLGGAMLAMGSPQMMANADQPLAIIIKEAVPQMAMGLISEWTESFQMAYRLSASFFLNLLPEIATNVDWIGVGKLVAEGKLEQALNYALKTAELHKAFANALVGFGMDAHEAHGDVKRERKVKLDERAHAEKLAQSLPLVTDGTRVGRLALGQDGHWTFVELNDQSALPENLVRVSSDSFGQFLEGSKTDSSTYARRDMVADILERVQQEQLRKAAVEQSRTDFEKIDKDLSDGAPNAARLKRRQIMVTYDLLIVEQQSIPKSLFKQVEEVKGPHVLPDGYYDIGGDHYLFDRELYDARQDALSLLASRQRTVDAQIAWRQRQMLELDLERERLRKAKRLTPEKLRDIETRLALLEDHIYGTTSAPGLAQEADAVRNARYGVDANDRLLNAQFQDPVLQRAQARIRAADTRIRGRSYFEENRTTNRNDGRLAGEDHNNLHGGGQIDETAFKEIFGNLAGNIATPSQLAVEHTADPESFVRRSDVQSILADMSLKVPDDLDAPTAVMLLRKIGNVDSWTLRLVGDHVKVQLGAARFMSTNSAFNPLAVVERICSIGSALARSTPGDFITIGRIAGDAIAENLSCTILVAHPRILETLAYIPKEFSAGLSPLQKVEFVVALQFVPYQIDAWAFKTVWTEIGHFSSGAGRPYSRSAADWLVVTSDSRRELDAAAWGDLKAIFSSAMRLWSHRVVRLESGWMEAQQLTSLDGVVSHPKLQGLARRLGVRIGVDLSSEDFFYLLGSIQQEVSGPLEGRNLAHAQQIARAKIAKIIAEKSEIERTREYNENNDFDFETTSNSPRSESAGAGLVQQIRTTSGFETTGLARARVDVAVLQKKYAALLEQLKSNDKDLPLGARRFEVVPENLSIREFIAELSCAAGHEVAVLWVRDEKSASGMRRVLRLGTRDNRGNEFIPMDDEVVRIAAHTHLDSKNSDVRVWLSSYDNAELVSRGQQSSVVVAAATGEAGRIRTNGTAPDPQGRLAGNDERTNTSVNQSHPLEIIDRPTQGSSHLPTTEQALQTVLEAVRQEGLFISKYVELSGRSPADLRDALFLDNAVAWGVEARTYEGWTLPVAVFIPGFGPLGMVLAYSEKHTQRVSVHRLFTARMPIERRDDYVNQAVRTLEQGKIDWVEPGAATAIDRVGLTRAELAAAARLGLRERDRNVWLFDDKIIVVLNIRTRQGPYRLALTFESGGSIAITDFFRDLRRSQIDLEKGDGRERALAECKSALVESMDAPGAVTTTGIALALTAQNLSATQVILASQSALETKTGITKVEVNQAGGTFVSLTISIENKMRLVRWAFSPLDLQRVRLMFVKTLDQQTWTAGDTANHAASLQQAVAELGLSPPDEGFRKALLRKLGHEWGFRDNGVDALWQIQSAIAQGRFFVNQTRTQAGFLALNITVNIRQSGPPLLQMLSVGKMADSDSAPFKIMALFPFRDRELEHNLATWTQTEQALIAQHKQRPATEHDCLARALATAFRLVGRQVSPAALPNREPHFAATMDIIRLNTGNSVRAEDSIADFSDRLASYVPGSTTLVLLTESRDNNAGYGDVVVAHVPRVVKEEELEWYDADGVRLSTLEVHQRAHDKLIFSSPISLPFAFSGTPPQYKSHRISGIDATNLRPIGGHADDSPQSTPEQSSAPYNAKNMLRARNRQELDLANKITAPGTGQMEISKQDLMVQLHRVRIEMEQLRAVIERRPITMLPDNRVPPGYYLSTDGRRYLYDSRLFAADMAKQRNPESATTHARVEKIQQGLRAQNLRKLAAAYRPDGVAAATFGHDTPWDQLSVPEIKAQLFAQFGISIHEQDQRWTAPELREIAKILSDFGPRAENSIGLITRMRAAIEHGKPTDAGGLHDAEFNEIKLTDGAFYKRRSGRRNAQINPTRDIFPHELGHALLPRGQNQGNGWTSVDEAGLRQALSNQGVTENINYVVTNLELTRHRDYRRRSPIRVFNQLYMVDPDVPGRFYIMDGEPIPGEDFEVSTEARMEPLFASDNPAKKRWDYGQTSPLEQGAESIMFGTNDPRYLYAELVIIPGQVVRFCESEVAAKGTDIASAHLKQATIDRDRKLEQWNRLRIVFGSNNTWVETLTESLPLLQRQHFRDEAARRMTPRQIADLHRRLGGRTPMDRLGLSATNDNIERVVDDYLMIEYRAFDESFRTEVSEWSPERAPSLFAFLELQAKLPLSQRSSFAIKSMVFRLLDDGRIASHSTLLHLQSETDGTLQPTCWSQAMERGGFTALFEEAMRMAAKNPEQLYYELCELPRQQATQNQGMRIRLFQNLWQLVRAQAGIYRLEATRIHDTMLRQIPQNKMAAANPIVQEFYQAAERVCTRKQLALLVQKYTKRLLQLVDSN